MTNTEQPTYKPEDDEIDLGELFAAIWQGKLLILAITAVFAVAGVLFALSKPNIYKSEALLAPSQAESSMSGMAAKFGGLASLAGINLGGGGATDNTQLALQVIKSRKFFEYFLTKHEIKPELMAWDKWDPYSQVLSFDPDVYNPTTKQWLREANFPRQSEPSLQESHEVFIKNHFNVSQDKETGLVTISIEHISPVVARTWAQRLVQDINWVMKERTKAETSKNISYLEQQLAKTTIAEMQTVFYQLIEEQTKQLMLAETNDDFVFKTIDPAVVPELKSGPKRALICVLAVLLGGMLSVAIVLVRYFANK
ncbi:Wzz/FepE/Etk N-terminal domain-containing protein [Paraferrimonas sp. SM1919]|uniref:Wzz/FepE/Etk N-terminal domain-containing protein n=1 Tax=Paraferrimonas sp. SM1919 TaxID=2662263 RepID=UPI0013D1E631|nr:Wzz/FepE/Etk N-terminal domain-containing protein [Paraferrimonas sp. SM1919]